MLSITLGKSDITAEEVGDRIKVTFNQEFKIDPVTEMIIESGPMPGELMYEYTKRMRELLGIKDGFKVNPVKRFPGGGFCYKPDQAVGENTQAKFDPEMPAPYSKVDQYLKDSILVGLQGKPVIPSPFPSFMDHFIKNAAIDLKSKAAAIGREPLPHEMEFAFDGHSISALLRRSPVDSKFKVGQSVFFFGGEDRFWNGIIKELGKTEALIDCKGLTWLPLESIHLTLDEAYAAQEIEEKEAKEKADRLSRAESFKIGQEAYYIALDCGAYKSLKCTIVDMGEYEASIKLTPIVRRSIVDAKDVFHTRNEANDEIFIRQQILNSRG